MNYNIKSVIQNVCYMTSVKGLFEPPKGVVSHRLRALVVDYACPTLVYNPRVGNGCCLSYGFQATQESDYSDLSEHFVGSLADTDSRFRGHLLSHYTLINRVF